MGRSTSPDPSPSTAASPLPPGQGEGLAFEVKSGSRSTAPWTAAPVDVALVLEGTYPYALGGVSTWTHALLEDLGELTFGVLHLGGRDAPGAPAFVPPPNVRWVDAVRLPDRLDTFDAAPLAAGRPAARVVHALSTGFASEVAAAWAEAADAALVVTEHGLSWREIERGAPELETGLRLFGHDLSDGNPCASRALWADRFRAMARRAYAAADAVTTVCEANRAEQLALGAPASRVIPNGVATPDQTSALTAAELDRLHPSARLPAEVRIGLVGRVTPLKDVLAFVRAAGQVVASGAAPGVRFFVVGPTDDAAYLARCRFAIAAADLDAHLHLTGAQPAELWHRHLDGVALTSVSEAQPLALLEAMAHGRPTVATDVGGCRALALGDGDRLGAAGLVVPPGDDAAMAVALASLASDAELRHRLGAVGRARVARSFSRTAVADSYRALYQAVAAA